MNIINWKTIVAECGGYKAAFVATFRKYEGMPTDETSDGGRTIKVTVRSFAEHNGIAENTFRTWVKRASSTDSVDERQARTTASHANVAKNMAKKSPSALVDAIELAGPTAVDQVFHDLKQRRAGHGPSKRTNKADAKGKRAKSAAVADAAVAPINQSLLQIIPAQLEEIAEEVEGAIAKNMMSSQLLESIEEAAQRLLNTVQAGKVFVS
jgi:transposase-like protein